MYRCMYICPVQYGTYRGGGRNVLLGSVSIVRCGHGVGTVQYRRCSVMAEANTAQGLCKRESKTGSSSALVSVQ